ncbi:ethanolamine-phosphate phospho-lyase [Biomphalaria glabrata]|uniref:Ethanolamine-phosphate phospho-lyase-like n=1 Tax=Biomphalaria glabrata TaxID=6526 RepID=A0A9W2ZN56_BIOGL|nr:ethanolamine-phosphate phospho-lyase-like [Biomphalaria glabrata]XP_055876388.1 ethanolamine-phosphate phospho-lyase-like [Biomphalaria glabrata]KAI8765537.1 ethanolamine-phosphate phospho-lyase-like [Biomphalaria glabrata]
MNGSLTKEQTLNLRKQFIGPSCTLFFKSDPVKIVSAKGQYMYDEEGHEYLDCINNVAHVGHCHPQVVAAGVEQMGQLNTNSRFLHDNIVLLAQKLVSHLPNQLCMVYFTNSGSEANDLALRLSRHHTKGTEIIALDRAYHGHVVSLIDLSTYKLDRMIDGVHTKPDFVHIAECPDTYRGKYNTASNPNDDLATLYANNVEDILDNIAKKDKQVCCFIAESMQSCGGQVIYPPGYLTKVFQSVRAAGGVCILDEVQVGFGRVGTHMWSFSTQNVVPDILTLGKPMGNGHPLSAVITTKEIAASFEGCGVEYFNTYGGNPVSCAIGLAVLDVIEKDKLLENAVKIGKLMETKLNELKEKYTLIGDVRGVGMFWGLDLVKSRATRAPATEEAAYIVSRLKEEYILFSRDGPDENVLKFKAPMCFNKDNVEHLILKLDKILAELTSNKEH